MTGPRFKDERFVPLTPPRPLWQIKEELAQHLKERPGNHDVQALYDWLAKRERLQLWVDYCESPY